MNIRRRKKEIMEAYLVEVGVLLTKEDEDYDAYCGVYDLKYGYYDENQFYMKEKEKAIKYAKKYAKKGIDRTYGIVSITSLPDDFDFEKEIVEGESYNLKDVVFSNVKIGDEILEDFLVNDEKLDSLRELLTDIINESENNTLSEKRRKKLDELYLETDLKIKELEEKAETIACKVYGLKNKN